MRVCERALKPVIRVALWGEHWDSLERAFESLFDKWVADFVRPVRQSMRDAVSLVRPSVIMVSPGLAGLGSLRGDGSRDAGLALPPVLPCVDQQGLETEELYEGTDDFLLVPCPVTELEKRLSRLARNTKPESSHHLLRLGKITLDTAVYEVRLEGKRVDMAWMEFQLLRFPMENPGHIFTRDQLLSSVWSIDNFGGTRTVDVHIRRLRQKLGLHGNTGIRTVANVGYGPVDE